jgi:DeoR family ulaG and ulaABCDEF operon transcriptional repressor
MRARNPIMPLARIGTLITGDGLTDANHKMLLDAGIRVIIARPAPENS